MKRKNEDLDYLKKQIDILKITGTVVQLEILNTSISIVVMLLRINSLIYLIF